MSKPFSKTFRLVREKIGTQAVTYSERDGLLNGRIYMPRELFPYDEEIPMTATLTFEGKE